MINRHFTASYSNYEIVRDSAGDFVKQSGRIDSTAATAVYYLQIYDSETLPPNGTPLTTTPITPAPAALIDSQKLSHTNGTDTRWDIDGTDGRAALGIPFAKGLVWCISSTENTLTLVASNVARVTTLTL